MKRNRLLLCVFILALLMAVKMPVQAASSAAKVTLSASSASYSRGERMEVFATLSEISDQSGIEGVDIEAVTYDSQVLSFVSMSVVSMPTGWESSIQGSSAMLTDDSGGLNPIKTGGKLKLKITFDVKSDAEYGKTSVSISGSGTNGKLDYVGIDFGTVEVDIVSAGSVSLSNTAFLTAWGIDFASEIKARQTSGTGANITLTFDPLVVSLKSYSPASGVTVAVDGNKITVSTKKAITNGMTLVSLMFTTSDELVSGEYDFISCDEKNTSSFSKLKIYQIGDVNMDGNVNSRDVLLIKQYAVKMIKLTDVQLVYADAYTDGKVNSRDALVISQSVVHMKVTLGDRKTVTFVSGEKTITRSVHSGKNLTQIPSLPEGYAWSASSTSYVAPSYKAITEDKHYYARKVS